MLRPLLRPLNAASFRLWALSSQMTILPARMIRSPFSVQRSRLTSPILRFHFKGDILGLPLLAFADSPETVTAVTDVALAPFSREKLALLIGDHPRLGALILGLSVAERVALADRLASIGRTSARARVGSLLCEVFARMRRLGLEVDEPA